MNEIVPNAVPREGQDAAARRVAGALSPAAIDRLLADAEDAGVGIDGEGGLLQQMMKAVLERALQVEMADHLGYEAGDPADAARATRATAGIPRP